MSYFMLSQLNVLSACRKRFNFLVFTKTKVDLNQNFRRSLLGYKDKATIKKLQGNSQGLQKDGILPPRGAFATPCHPKATGLGCM